MDPDSPDLMMIDDPGSTTDSVPELHDDPGTSTDSEPALNVDLGFNLEIESALHDNLLSDTEEAASHQLVFDTAEIRCVNCGNDLTQRRIHNLHLAEVLTVIRQWVAPQIIGESSVVCHSCWTSALHQSREQVVDEASTSTGHRRNLCVSCGSSLLRMRSHMLHTSTERESRIRNIIIEQIMPRQLRGSDQICHPCWQRSDRTASQPLVPPHTHRDTSIDLPDYSRAPDTQAQCFVPECQSTERRMVPKWLRVLLFAEYKYYVPTECRICTFHLQNPNWELLVHGDNGIHTFTADHIQDFATFVNEKKLTIDLTDVEGMSDEQCHYWLGLSKENFRQIKAELPRLQSLTNGSIALATYLMKLKTGDTDERISTLLNIPRTTLMRMMAKARKMLEQDFVPRNLGINNITRAEIVARNLLIPNGLFGGDADNRRPVVIMDGTYLYIQKSSNYFYQRETYSLHKYRNLMKPFIIVSSDGYIIDVMGPYSAKTSDAAIILNEFSDPSKPLRQYFQDGDVFILDRGFRDAVPLLQACNYSLHMPESLQAGESQLSTLAANRSRTVTICRWVVEAVNGIFKQSFRLFRREFFNRASKHAMLDFRVAAALINRFHQRITDRPDAREILSIINERMFMNNYLCDLVIENNMNRRQAQFVNINANSTEIHFPRLELNDLILLACGTYQIKQARSYYGEHIKPNGSYIIEVCRAIPDRGSNLLGDIPRAPNSTMLRGKIQSRHIRHKIYYVYIIFQNNGQGREAIKEYYCNCLVGRRTVGCCAHIMTIIWFLSWARYQDNINPPAQFLDDILIVFDS